MVEFFFHLAAKWHDEWRDADELVIENLKPETDYLFRVRAKNDVGVGKETAEIRATTTEISEYSLIRYSARSIVITSIRTKCTNTDICTVKKNYNKKQHE